MTEPRRGTVDLPLRWVTPPEWAAGVLESLAALLNDHAHLEKKAARNALELLDRWPGPVPPAAWIQTMTAVARDEIEHLALVARLLQRRSYEMSKHHRNPYASALRGLVRTGQGPRDLIDRLMISALIEARSCERFRLLAEHCPDAQLARMYRGLWASEHGHYLVFLEMARLVQSPREVRKRWGEMLDAEAQIIAAQAPGPRMHSGLK